MLRALAKIIAGMFALMAIAVAIVWWRSARHVDVLKFEWSRDSEHSISLISHAGGLHLDYTTLHPLSTLRHSPEWTFSFLPDDFLSPEVDASSDHAHFAHLEDFQIRVPMQGLFQDLRHTQPVYQTETLPMKLISAPAWFVLAVFAAHPLVWLIWSIRHRRPRKPSRILWLARRPALCAAGCTFLLILPWVRGCWRADDLQCDIGRYRYIISSTAGALGLNRQSAEGTYDEFRGVPGVLTISLSDADNVNFSDAILPPVEYTTNQGWRFPYWIAVVLLTSVAVASTIRRRLAPVFPEGCCRRCGYDLRASAGRCPECGLEDTAQPPITRARRASVSGMLWLAIIFTFGCAILGAAWFRSRSKGTSSLIEVAYTPQARLYIEHTDLNFATGSWPLLPTLAGLAGASILLFWLAVRRARLRP